MTEAPKDSVAEAQAKVDVERARVSATIAELRRRADPRAMVEEAKENALQTASQFAGNASRLANAGVATVKRQPEVAGAAAGGVGLIAALFAWRSHSKRKQAKALNARIAGRASVSDVLDPPATNPFDTAATRYPDDAPEFEPDTTQPGSPEPAQQETIYGQEHQQR